MQPVLVSLEEQEVHRNALQILNAAGIHYVVAGAVALGYYTGLWRHTKDLDVFLTPDDLTPALTTLAAHGYSVNVPATHWLAHGYRGDYYVDLIFGFGGWRAPIDQQWYERGRPGTVLGVPVRVAPVEDMIWIKAYVAHRERFDGADIVHMIRACHESIDWMYLLQRFDPGWQLLMFYVNLYQFIYPSEKSDFPVWFLRELGSHLLHQWNQPVPEPPLCRGTLLDRFSYLIDIREGLRDARERWVIAQGFSPRELQHDREEAEQVVREGRVRPDRAA